MKNKELIKILNHEIDALEKLDTLELAKDGRKALRGCVILGIELSSILNTIYEKKTTVVELISFFAWAELEKKILKSIIYQLGI